MAVPYSEATFSYSGVENYLNRELSQVDFIARVISIAEDPSTPLLERIKFLAISAQNLDHFFQVRVSGLKTQLESQVAARSPDVARRSAMGASVLYVIVGSVPLGIGLLGPALHPGLEDPERILPLVAAKLLPTVGYVVCAGALISAILSTVDSTLLAAASLVSHNLVARARPGMSEREKVFAARVGVVNFGVAAYLLALSSDGVHELVQEASGFGSAASQLLK